MGFWQSLSNLDWKTFSIKEFIEGCSEYYLIDYVIPEHKTRVENMIKYRLSICNECKMNENGWCNNTGNVLIEHVQTKQLIKGCGCNLNCKAARADSSCPAAKWKSINL